MSRQRGSWRRGRLSATVVLTLALAASLPAVSQAAKVGGGEVLGTMVFDPPGIPQLGAPCKAPDFEFEETIVVSFVLDTQIVGYVGTAELAGNGTTGCQTASAGGGSFTAVTLGGTSELNGSELACQLTGTFTRVGTEMHVRLHGPCTINEFDASNVAMSGVWQFVPDGLEDDAGTSQPITSAQIAGHLTVLPG